MLIAVEGMDGVGKTTICNYIEKKYNFINIEKPCKYLHASEEEFYKYLDVIYKRSSKERSIYFGKGNVIASKKYPNKNVVLDRHLGSNYY